MSDNRNSLAEFVCFFLLLVVLLTLVSETWRDEFFEFVRMLGSAWRGD